MKAVAYSVAGPPWWVVGINLRAGFERWQAPEKAMAPRPKQRKSSVSDENRAGNTQFRTGTAGTDSATGRKAAPVLGLCVPGSGGNGREQNGNSGNRKGRKKKKKRERDHFLPSSLLLELGRGPSISGASKNRTVSGPNFCGREFRGGGVAAVWGGDPAGGSGAGVDLVVQLDELAGQAGPARRRRKR